MFDHGKVGYIMLGIVRYRELCARNKDSVSVFTEVNSLIGLKIYHYIKS